MTAKGREERRDFTIDLQPVARGFDRALVRFMQMSILALALIFMWDTAQENSGVIVLVAVALAIGFGMLES